MDHTIEFRAKTLDGSRWLYGDLLTPHGGGTKLMIRHTDEDGNETVEEVDPDTIGQYTSWDDFQGDPVYEGDFVECFQLIQQPGERWPEVVRILGSVIFDKGGFSVALPGLGEFGSIYPMQLLEFAEEIGELEFSIRNKDKRLDYSKLPEHLASMAKAKTLDQVVMIFNGLQVLGNIHDNPGTLEKILESKE